MLNFLSDRIFAKIIRFETDFVPVSLELIKSRPIVCIVILSCYCEELPSANTSEHQEKSFWFGLFKTVIECEMKCDVSAVGGSGLPSVSKVPSCLKRERVECFIWTIIKRLYSHL